MGIKITGAQELRILGRALKDAGDKQLRRELFRAAQRTTRPVKAAIKQSAKDTLPTGGGLNLWTAQLGIKTRTAVSGRNVGVTITGKKNGHDVRKINAGRVRPRYWGRQLAPPSRIQNVTPGFWDKPLNTDIADVASKEFYEAMQRVAAEIARR